MTKHDIETTFGLIDQLWPGNQLTEAVREILGERMERIAIAFVQAKAALSEYRVHCRFRTPDTDQLLNRLRAAEGMVGAVNTGRPLEEWERWRIQAKLPGSYDAEATIAVWTWRLCRKFGESYGHEFGSAALYTNYCVQVMEVLKWTKEQAMDAAQSRWGPAPEPAIAWMAKCFGEPTSSF